MERTFSPMVRQFSAIAGLQQGLVKVRINGHEIPPSVGYIIIILTQSGRGVKPHFGKNGENPRKNLAE